MPDVAEPAICRFKDFLLDKREGLFRLHSDGRKTPVQLGSRALRILCLLVDRRGEIVSRREIMDAVWHGIAVEPNNLTVQLTALRRALDADRGQGSCIQNVPGRGYRFVPRVTEIDRPPDDGAVRAPSEVDPSWGVAQSAETVDTLTAQPEPPPANAPTAHFDRWLAARRIAWAATSCLAVVALAAAVILYQGRPQSFRVEQTATQAPPASPVQARTERPRLSLVVLPFLNLGGEGLDDASVDAVTEDVTTQIARYARLLVTARNSAFEYKGHNIDVKRVGEELGVRYALAGSVRKADGRLRIDVQLVSTETGAHVWADRFDVGRDKAAYDRDNIVRQITFVAQARLADAENERNARERPANPDFTDTLTRAQAVYNLPQSAEKTAQLVALYEHAVELDPTSPIAQAGLAEALLESVPLLSIEDPSAPAKFRRAEALIAQAELVRPNDWQVMLARLLLLGRQFRCPQLVPFAQRTSEAHPYLSTPHMLQGMCLMTAGQAAEAIPHFKQAIHVHPRNPNQNTRYSCLGYASLFLGRYEEAVAFFQQALGVNPAAGVRSRAENYAAMAAAQALTGDIAAARVSAAEAIQLAPTLTAQSYFWFNVTNPEQHNATNQMYAEQVSRMRDGLRLAGIRDHADEQADANLPPDDVLHADHEAPTPTVAPGVSTIRTQELAVLLERRKPLVVDVIPWGRSVPEAIGLWGAGIGGSTTDQYQDRLRQKMQQLTRGNRGLPIVTVAWNAERYHGRNLALRLVALGYTEVYWYRGGREAWLAAGLPVAHVAVQEW
jgi:adenylate cyclase